MILTIQKLKITISNPYYSYNNKNIEAKYIETETILVEYYPTLEQFIQYLAKTNTDPKLLKVYEAKELNIEKEIKISYKVI